MDDRSSSKSHYYGYELYAEQSKDFADPNENWRATVLGPNGHPFLIPPFTLLGDPEQRRNFRPRQLQGKMRGRTGWLYHQTFSQDGSANRMSDTSNNRQQVHKGNKSENRGKGHKDANTLAFEIAQMATGQAGKPAEKNPAAVTLGRLGGLKGGKARASALTPEKRREIAKKAAEKRWSLKARG